MLFLVEYWQDASFILSSICKARTLIGISVPCEEIFLQNFSEKLNKYKDLEGEIEKYET